MNQIGPMHEQMVRFLLFNLYVRSLSTLCMEIVEVSHVLIKIGLLLLLIWLRLFTSDAKHFFKIIIMNRAYFFIG